MKKSLALTTAVAALLALGAVACTDDRPAPAATDGVSRASVAQDAAAPAAAAEPETPAGGASAPVDQQGGSTPARQAAFDAGNATFLLEGRPVSLKNGVSVAAAAPGSASTVTVRRLGAEARGDLNRDGREDRAFVVTRDGGGSGTFYYAVAAMASPDGYRTTNAFPLGDRIAFQSMIIPRNSSQLHVNFARRRAGEPMTTAPSADSVLILTVTAQGVLQGAGD